MLCKTLTCRFEAVERRIVPFGAVNLCEDHARTWDSGTEAERHVLADELKFACRYGPVEDPPLSEPFRGPAYAHQYKSGMD